MGVPQINLSALTHLEMPCPLAGFVDVNFGK